MKSYCKLGGMKCEHLKKTVRRKPDLCFWYRNRGMAEHSIAIERLVLCPKVQSEKLERT